MQNKNLSIRRERPFVMVDHAVVMNGMLSVYELAVYVVLCAYADHQDATCFPSYQTIARRAGCSRRKAIDTIARLESLGLIRKELRHNSCGDNTSNLYTIVSLPPLCAPPGDAEQSLTDAYVSLPDADDTPEPYPVNHNQNNQKYLSIQRWERWKAQIEYEYFQTEMPNKLPLVDVLLGIFVSLEEENDPRCRNLLPEISSCTVMELIEEFQDKDFCGVRNFTAYLKKLVVEYLIKSQAQLAQIV